MDSIGVGSPTSQDLDCNGKIAGDRAPAISMEPFVVRGGLEAQAEQTFRAWRRYFGVVRVCFEKHLPQGIGTRLNERLMVNISESGLISDITFQENQHAAMADCMKGYVATKTIFPAARKTSELSLQLKIRMGNSDYQIKACDRLAYTE